MGDDNGINSYEDYKSFWYISFLDGDLHLIRNYYDSTLYDRKGHYIKEEKYIPSKYDTKKTMIGMKKWGSRKP